MGEIIRSADRVMNIVEDDPARLQALKDNTLHELKKITKEAKEQAPPIYTQDIWIYRMVVGVLAVVIIITAVGGIYMSISSPFAQIPDAVIALGSASIGALVGLLAPAPGGK